MAPMNALTKRLVRPDERLRPADFARNPRVRHRLTVTNIGKQLTLATSTCRRTLCADGSLFEIVGLDRTGSLVRRRLETFIESFPVDE
jgi:hypothetical protein